MLSLRDALGSRWNANWSGWAMLFVPTTLVVFLQEAETGLVVWWAVLASAIAQHVSSIIVAFMIATPARRTWGMVPLGASMAIWLMIGIARGVIGGLFAEAFTGTADYGYRVFSWVLISVIWMPLFVYTMAQFDHRRVLLARLSDVTERRNAARERHAESAAQFRRRVLGTVQEMIAPALNEVRASLAAASTASDSASLHHVGERLTELAGEAARIVDTEVEPVAHSETPRPSLIAEAVRYDIDRPVVVAALTGLALLPAILLHAVPSEDPIGVWGDLAALGAGVLVFAAGLLVLARVGRHLPTAASVAATLTLTLVAGFAGSTVLWLLDSPLPVDDQVLAAVLPIGFAFGAIVILTAVSVTAANRRVAGDILDLQEQAGALGAKSRRAERRLREQVSSLIHGPVHGRLAACAMALNFLADEPDADVDHAAQVAERVLAHLDAASADLEVLAKGGTHVASTT